MINKFSGEWEYIYTEQLNLRMQCTGIMNGLADRLFKFVCKSALLWHTVGDWTPAMQSRGIATSISNLVCIFLVLFNIKWTPRVVVVEQRASHMKRNQNGSTQTSISVSNHKQIHLRWLLSLDFRGRKFVAICWLYWISAFSLQWVRSAKCTENKKV